MEDFESRLNTAIERNAFLESELDDVRQRASKAEAYIASKKRKRKARTAARLTAGSPCSKRRSRGFRAA